MFKKHLLAILVLCLVHGICSAADEQIERRDETRGKAAQGVARPGDETDPLTSWRDLDRWSFQGGIGFINGDTIDEIIADGGELAKGDAGGEIYLLQVSYKAAALKPTVFGQPLEIDIEVPFVLGGVDENGREPFMQYNLGVTLRWKRFPWNRWLYTNLETGVGLTYSAKVLEIERERHPNRDRSHVEFYWPVQLMLAHPRHRQHQLALFLHHHSGATLFHRGGANTLGIGYRYVPGER